MYCHLTVEETLMFSANTRLPSTMSKAEKAKRVEDVISSLGLNGCRNTRIGNAAIRGISGGERKRVSIGVELVSDPSILFLDEPTSGLDAFNAFNAMSMIKKLAISSNKIVLLTIHQPRTDILDLFDKVVLLSMGRTVWFGPTKDALLHFEQLGFPLPPKTNPSDYFLDIITLDQRSDELKAETTARIEKFAAAYEAVRKNHLSEAPPDAGIRSKTTNGGLFNKVEWASTWSIEFVTLIKRNLIDVRRDAGTLGATLGQGVFLTILLGFIFYQVQLDIAGIQNRIGVLFFLCVNQSFGVVMPSLPVFTEQRDIIKHERAGGSYRSSSAYVAKVLSTLPLTFAGSLILALPIYWMVGLQASATKYLTFVCIILVQSFAANSLGILIGSAIPNIKTGQIIAPLVIVIFFLFAGQVLNVNSVPQVFRWIQWVSIIAYSNKALAQNEFDENLKFPCVQGQPCYSNGLDVISAFSLGTPSLWICVIINVSIAIGFLILGFFFFELRTRPLSKLK